jgi:hypothetical protein
MTPRQNSVNTMPPEFSIRAEGFRIVRTAKNAFKTTFQAGSIRAEATDTNVLALPGTRRSIRCKTSTVNKAHTR